MTDLLSDDDLAALVEEEAAEPNDESATVPGVPAFWLKGEDPAMKLWGIGRDDSLAW